MNAADGVFHRLAPRSWRRARQRSMAFGILVLSLVAAPVAPATDRFWTGAAGTDWGTNGNWDTGSPSADDVGVFNSTFTNQPSLGNNKSAGGVWMTDGIGQNVSVSGTFQLSLSGTSINGTAGLGILVDNANAYTLSFNGPTIKVAGDQAWRNNSGNLLTIGGAGVDINGKALTIDGTGNTLVTAVLSNSGAFTKAGTGTLTLSGTNTYTGTTTVSAGVLNIQNAGALGVAAAGTTVGSGATLQLQGGITVGAEALNITGTGAGGQTGALVNVSGTNNYGGLLTLAGATTLSSDSGTLNLTNAGTITGATFGLTLAGAGNGTISGIIGTTSGTLTKAGAGTWTISAANTYTGLTTVNAGTLRYGASNVISSGAVTVNGATANLDLVANQTDTVGTVTLAGGGSITGTGTSALTSTGTFEMQSGSASAILTGTGIVLNKTTTGTVTLSGANGYTGATAISAGILNIQNGTGLGTTAAGTTVSSGATLQLQGGITVGAEALNINGSGAGGQTGALVNVGGTNNYGGLITLAGATMVSSDSGTLNLTNAGTISGATFGLTLAGAGNGTVSGIIGTTSGTLTKTGAGTWTLSVANTYTGATTVSGGILAVGVNDALGTAASGTTVNSGGTLRLQAGLNYTTAEALAIHGTGSGGVGALTTSGAGTTTFAGQVTVATHALISSGGGTLNLNGGVVKNGTTATFTGGGIIHINTVGISGSSANSDLVVDGTTLVLNVANSYNGPTTVLNSGVLQLGASNVLPTSPQTALTLNSSGVFDLASFNDSVASLAGEATGLVRNSTASTTSTLTVNPASGSTTFAGTIAGTGGGNGDITLIKTGAGTLSLSGTNTYSGTTTVNAGILQTAGTGAFNGTAGLLIQTGGAVQNTSGNHYGAGFYSGSSRTATVTGSGSQWTSTTALYVGGTGTGNQLVVSSGGGVVTAGAGLGFSAGGNGNTALITGTGSLWTNTGSFYVGISGSTNSLTISNGGQTFKQRHVAHRLSKCRQRQHGAGGWHRLAVEHGARRICRQCGRRQPAHRFQWRPGHQPRRLDRCRVIERG